jgi:hypothetical protein
VKAYWDTSALIASFADADLESRLITERGFSRTHSFAEIFAALTGGNLAIRVDADEAAGMVEDIASYIDVIDLTATEVLVALKTARSKGVRGGRVHDYLHAVAAAKSGAAELLTGDTNDFAGLSAAVAITQI